jgi:deoxyribodipyrimidine photolyase-like uncharacterized protein
MFTVFNATRGGLAVFLMTFAPLAFGQTKSAGESVVTEEHPVSYWMQKKLEYSQAILAGLASGEMEKIAKAAEQMKVLNRVEGFIRSQVPGYPEQMHAFEFATQEVERQARLKNLEGSTLAFHQLTTSCVNCHKLIREQRR